MTDVSYFKDRFEQLQGASPDGDIAGVRLKGFDTFTNSGLPSLRNEEWKYTNISSLFNKEYHVAAVDEKPVLSDVDFLRLPGHSGANELVFVNGRFMPTLSTIRSPDNQLTLMPLEDAANGIYKELVKEHLGQSSKYLKDGIHALNTSFISGGVFIHIAKKQQLEHPIYLYHVSDARDHHTLSQPRSLVYAGEGSKLQLVETYQTIGTADSFTNQVMEVVVNNDTRMEYYKLQNDSANASQVSTTHIRQAGRSYVHAVTITLNGGMIRNNMNLVLDAAGNETHLYGLYLLNGRTHADNHTLVDNRMPNCFSNQLYKGIVDDNATAVFNGKIMVQPQAQKTNAYQSNKNILLTDQASINTKPQLEIFADDVKCSHGCTVGQLDETALFYLRARGIPKENAQAMLLQAFTADILVQVKPLLLREHIRQLITVQLFNNK
ncbi:Fe-S cluster assembly protein SufD [Mucilaginibacter sp.]|uniref:Fe-S cluster assembly protein SufD n=1 Tax=Mucilaginibacter sp. TaxID=1882438 RepID=UPI002609BB85|nr:Fe-S cluster assembly protein SufD [Mucilaginibacter sp.]MDB4922508.1 Fe-S cluster assembly protein SufD [Mucilaginibacter sp.]